MHFYLSQWKIAFALLLFPASPWCAYCSFSWSKRSNEDHKRRYISSSEKHLPSATSVCKSEATFSLLKITTYGYSFNNFLHSSNPSIKKMHTYHTTAKFFFFYFFFFYHETKIFSELFLRQTLSILKLNIGLRWATAKWVGNLCCCTCFHHTTMPKHFKKI